MLPAFVCLISWKKHVPSTTPFTFLLLYTNFYVFICISALFNGLNYLNQGYSGIRKQYWFMAASMYCWFAIFAPPLREQSKLEFVVSGGHHL